MAQFPALGPYMSLSARPIYFYLYIGLVIHAGGKLIRYNKQVQRYADKYRGMGKHFIDYTFDQLYTFVTQILYMCFNQYT